MPRLRLKDDEYDLIQNYRERNKGIVDECEAVGIGLKDVNYYWYKGEHYSINAKGAQNNDLRELRDSIINSVKKYATKYPVIKYPKIKEGHILVIDPADIHVGKLCSSFETGDEYNHQIAVDRVKSGVAGILQKSEPFKIDKILFIIGNDALHVDNAKHTTTDRKS